MSIRRDSLADRFIGDDANSWEGLSPYAQWNADEAASPASLTETEMLKAQPKAK